MFSWVTHKFTKRTLRSTLENILHQYCDSFEWDSSSSAVTGSVLHVHNISIRAGLADAFLRPFGLCVTGPANVTPSSAIKIGELRVTMEFEFAADLGIFSKPWRIDIKDVSCAVCVLDEEGASVVPKDTNGICLGTGDGTDAEAHPAPDDLSQQGQKDFLPLHRAFENARLAFHNIKLRVTAHDTGDVLEARVGQASLLTTDSTWNEVQRNVPVGDHDLVYKRLAFTDVEVLVESRSRLRRPGKAVDAGEADETGGEGMVGEFPPTRRTLVDGLQADVQLAKRLKQRLRGSVAVDFLASRYDVVMKAEARRPQLAVGPFGVSVEYDEPSGGYVPALEGGMAIKLAHACESLELVELMEWRARLSAAMAAADTMPFDDRLERAERQKALEHAKLLALHRRHMETRTMLDDVINGHVAAEASLKRQLERATILSRLLDAHLASDHSPQARLIREYARDMQRRDPKSFVRFVTMGTRSAKVDCVQLAQIVFLAHGRPLHVASVTNAGGQSPANEGAANVVDGSRDTKWLDNSKAPLVMELEGGPPDSYYLVTANDNKDRDPVRWVVEGSADGTGWHTLDDRSAVDQQIPTARKATSTVFAIGESIQHALPLPTY